MRVLNVTTTKYYLINYISSTDNNNNSQNIDSILADKCKQINMKIITVTKPSDLKNPFLQIVLNFANKLGRCVLLQ